MDLCKRCNKRKRIDNKPVHDNEYLCYKCYNINKFCINCFVNYHTDHYLCDYCYYLWEKGYCHCPYCKDSHCGARPGDTIKHCTNNKQFKKNTGYNSILKAIYRNYLVETNKD